MRGEGGEHVWNKQGSKFRLPRVPRPSRATVLRAAPCVVVVSLMLVGLLAVPAGSPPPPPAVAAAPITSVEPTETPTLDPVVEATPSEQPSPPPVCHPKGIGTHAVPHASKTGAASTIAYQVGGSLWLYDVASNVPHELARFTTACSYYWPRFIDARTVAITNGSRLYTFDTVTGASHVLNMHVGGDPQSTWLAAYEIAPSTSSLAVLENHGSNSFNLVVSSISSDKVLFKKTLGFVCQCDGGGAPIEVRWSRDGSLLAVDVAGPDTSNLLYVYDRAGKRVRGPLNGNAPRWLGTSHSFLYQDYAGGRLEWTTLDVTTSRSTPIPTGSGLTLPVVTPDGSRVAFNDDEAMQVVVYDFATRSETPLAGRHAYPVWLDNDRVMLSAVRPCNCEYPPYQPYGNAVSVSVLTGRTVRTRMAETSDADVLY